MAEKVSGAYDDEAGLLDHLGFDLLETMHKAGIRTICLNEAHHLKAAMLDFRHRAFMAVQEVLNSPLLPGLGTAEDGKL